MVKYRKAMGIKMIITLNKAIVHIIAAGIDNTMYSDCEIDLSDAGISSFIVSHLEKMYDDPGMRTGEFSSNSGLKYHISEYAAEQTSFRDLSEIIAKRLQEGISQSEIALPSDIIVCDCIIHERQMIAILKCDNKTGFTHRVLQEDGQIKNEIINYYAILPPVTQRLSDCAFIEIEDMTMKFKGKSVTLDGQKLNLMSDVLLECEYGISPKEALAKVQKTAKEITEEYGGDTVATDVKIKQLIKNTPVEEDSVKTEEIAEAVFEASPAAREEFIQKVREAEVPEVIEKTEYVEKRIDKNIKIVTDTGIEISFPAEYYRDEDNVSIINNDDGTISITINNISQILNKS